MTGRRHELVIPAPAPWLTSNIERSRYSRASLVRSWREATVRACLACQMPTGLERVELVAVIRYVTPRPPVRDRLNLEPTIKAIVDGLTPARVRRINGEVRAIPGYGLIADDSDRYVVDTRWTLQRAPATAARAFVEVTIIDRSPESLFDVAPAPAAANIQKGHTKQ